MKIGIVGFNGTLKSDVIRMLEQEGVCVASIDYTKLSTDDNLNQVAIMQGHLKNLDTEHTFMCGSLVDGYTYALWGALDGKISGRCLGECYKLLYDNYKRYDVLAYIDCDATEFAREVSALFRMVLKTLDIQVVELKGVTSEIVQELYCISGIFKG